ESALRELRGLKQAGDDLAAVRREKDMQIQELEDQLKNLERDYVKSVEEDTKDKGELKKQIDELNDKLYEEMSKVWRLDNERESQTRKIKRLIVDVLKKPDSTIPLKDRIKLLFKTYGVTISAIITAVVMTLTTLGLGISNALKPVSKPGPGPSPDPIKPDKPSIPDKVKEGLKKLAEWLKELAKKSAAALPGIIGSIVSFLLKSVGAAVGFLAEHLIIVFVIIVSSIIYGLIEGVKTVKNMK
ncbi:hypothetical protein, partial [Bartonella sp. CL41QHWL]|uniref:hypothetical protein n=1 Tax=Bartonella sp. CL41QHWL TaxID=3243527 RepID=UPI0035D03910